MVFRYTNRVLYDLNTLRKIIVRGLNRLVRATICLTGVSRWDYPNINDMFFLSVRPAVLVTWARGGWAGCEVWRRLLVLVLLLAHPLLYIGVPECVVTLFPRTMALGSCGLCCSPPPQGPHGAKSGSQGDCTV